MLVRPIAATWVVLALLLAVRGAAAQPAQPQHPAQGEKVEDPPWPRRFKAQDGTLVLVHQPQVEKWPLFHKLGALCAVSIQAPGTDEASATVGAIRIMMDTRTDHEARLVTLERIVVVEARFPSLDEAGAAKATETLKSVLPAGPVDISLDRLLADLARRDVTLEPVPVSNETPKIMMSHEPAVLVLIGSEPIYEPVPGTELEKVINTDSYLFRHKRIGRHYLVYGDGWLRAAELKGDWVADNNLPDTFDDLPDDNRWRGIRQRVPGKAIAMGEVPTVFVTTPPAELIVTMGEPRFSEIPGTSLMQVLNTESDLFKNTADGMYYGLVSGRWFRTQGRDFPVEWCTDDLPEDFSKIPPDHHCGRVLASVPGTPQAREAVIKALIPRTATVRRDKAKIDVTYIGEPQWTGCGGGGVEYATNTSLDVLRIGGHHYVCHDGVWFDSSGPNGPWTVCDSVPEAVYSIPVECPKFNLTFAYVWESTPETVEVACLGGYHDVYYDGSVLVRGTGYDSQPTPEFFMHYFKNWALWRGQNLYHHTYGYGYHYDHLSGVFLRTYEPSQVREVAHVRLNPFVSWGRSAVSAYRAPRAFAGEPVASQQGSEANLYAGPDGNVYRIQADRWEWNNRGAWNRYDYDLNVPGVAGPSEPIGRIDRAALAGRQSYGFEPGTWTRQTPGNDRSLFYSAQARDQSWRRHNQYWNYRGTYR